MTLATADLKDLSARCTGLVVTPDDAGWDAARQAWNLAFDLQPAAVALPADAGDVAHVVRFAREAGLRVAPQTTGHNPGPLGDLADTILIRTSAMTGIRIDAAARRARVGAGVLWDDLMKAAHAHGLVALGGSSPDVGVVGYSLGGGIGWLARRYGLATNSILAVELVTADGTFVRADVNHEPDLFWALRGGGGNFGVVTHLELELFPVSEVYAGAMVWDWSDSERVLARWSEWAVDAPDDVTTSARIMQLPPLPEIPEPLRGRQIVMIDGAYAGDADGAEPVLAPLRELEPEMDIFQTIPSAGLVRVHGDPEHPVPAVSDHTMLSELPREAVEAFVAAAGPDSGSTLVAAELRQLGGALGRPAARHGALPMLDASFAVFALGMAMNEQMAAAGVRDAARLVQAVAPWSNGRSYLNFTERATDTSTGYRGDVYERLQAIRERFDSEGTLRANHAIAAAS